MKIELHHIETAVRKQFVWDDTEIKTRWATKKAHNHGSKGLGASVFIGIAVQFGFTLAQIESYMDLEPLDIQAKLNAFNTRMKELMLCKLNGVAPEKMTRLMGVKKDMVISYIRLHYMKEFVSTSSLNH